MSFIIIFQFAGRLLTCRITEVPLQIEHQRSHKTQLQSRLYTSTLILDWYTLFQQWLDLEIEPFSKDFAHEINSLCTQLE
jgi:hypothetical protein